MKILLMGFTKVKYMPYANFYLDNLDRVKNEIHFLYWNRDTQTEDLTGFRDIQFHEFKVYQEDEIAKFSKIRNFLRYKRFAVGVIKREKFDFIIFMHSLPGVLIANLLIKKYKNRYIFDYRDSTYERFLPFKRVIGRLVKYSYATFVSSDAFRKFLPKEEEGKIYTSHNLLLDSLNHRDEKEKHGIESDKIRIGFWGFIRHENLNKEIIKKVAADERFELHYYGREQQTAKNLKIYTQSIGAKNIFFHGEYKPEDRYQFVRQTDIIHNIYCDDNMMLAMGNKFYDGIIFRIPQLCMKGSFMGEQVEKYGVGRMCDPYDSQWLEIVYEYYRKLNIENFMQRCEVLLERIRGQYLNLLDIIKDINLSAKNR